MLRAGVSVVVRLGALMSRVERSGDVRPGTVRLRATGVGVVGLRVVRSGD
jgi:hypothetical protein